MNIKTLTVNDFQDGQVLLIDKPLRWSSFQVVNKVRWLIKRRFGIKKIKVGHAGTLDPLATGLLVVCTGKKTREIACYQGQDKVYTGTLTLGATTPSYDLETEPDRTFSIDSITEGALFSTAKKFIGQVQQQPPVFSAVKKDGRRLYEYARKGETPDIPTRTITISAFDITRIALPEVDFEVRCSKGAYIRSLTHDFGKALGNGAHLSALRRTKIGTFDVENARTIEQLEVELGTSGS